MRLALMADIHSNLHALETFHERLETLDIDGVVCSGDVVGYGAFPNECCSWVEANCTLCVRGNHDRAAVDKDVSRMNPYAAAAAMWTHAKLDDRSKRFLSSLEDSARMAADGVRIAVFHGSPLDPEEYLEEELANGGLLAQADSEVLVLGHTHIPFRKRFAEGLVVNPGSIGQPRDGDPRGSFAVLDTEGMKCETIRFPYPIEEAARAIRDEGLPHMMAERLSVGR